MNRAKLCLLLGLMFVGLNALDAYVTQLLLRMGVAWEGNPIMRVLDVNMLVKIGLSALAVTGVYMLRGKIRPSWVMARLNIVMGCVVIWNTGLYLFARVCL